MTKDEVPASTARMTNDQEPMTNPIGAVLVVGSGIGGIQASLELADVGFKVYLLDEGPAIGGVMAMLDKTFPTNDCSMCILSPKLVGTGRHPNIEVITNSDVVGLSGTPGNFVAEVRKRPRYVDEAKCTGCGACTEVCPVTKAIYPVEKARTVLEEELKEVAAIVARHREKRGFLMPILQSISREYGYLPANALTYVSEELGVALSDIYNIATFYSAFSLEPRGRHLISVCMGTTCYVRGGERIVQWLGDELGVRSGQTTSDRRFTLESARCLGCCSLAPAVMIDGKVYGRVKPDKLGRILGRYK
jgi:NADH:ubiquinone oxidoreductase subunit E